MRKIRPDINLQNDIQKDRILESREYYKGKSFNFAQSWHSGIYYFNDSNVTDFVVYDNVLLACKKSHLSNSQTIPTIIYDQENPLQPIGVKSEYWSFVLSGIVNNDTTLRVNFSPTVESLPNAKDHVGEIYVVGPIGQSGNAYLEYIAIHTPSYGNDYTWELVGGGNTTIDLSNYVTKDELSLYVTKSELQNNNQTVSNNIKTWVNNQNYTTVSGVNKMIENAFSNVNLSNYYTKEEIDNKDFITSIPSEYVVESELSNTTKQLKSYIDEKNNHQDSTIASKQDTLINGQNIKTINGQNILGTGNIEIVGGETDLTNYYTKEEIESKEYITEDDVKTLVLDGGEIEFK